MTNPFSPGSDVVPDVWAGRAAQLRDWTDVVRPRRLAGRYERGRTILGEAGLGKSTLVRRIARSAQQEGDWVTRQLRIPAGVDPLKVLAEAMLALADRAGLPARREARLTAILDRVRAVSISGVSLQLDQGEGADPYRALTDLLVEIGSAAIQQGVVVLVHLDEVQNITDAQTLSQILICLGDASTHEVDVEVPGGLTVSRVLPIAVYLTGLPEFVDTTGSLTGATFARRFATTVLEPIDDEDIELALEEFVSPGWDVSDGRGGVARVHMEQAAVRAIVDVCRGEPFLFQLAGARAWLAGTGSIISRDEVLTGWEAARYEATQHVERILSRLPAKERQLLQVMADLADGERSATRIASEMGYASPTQIGSAAQRLDTTRQVISRGKPYRFRHRAIEAYLTSDWPARS